MIEHWTAHLQEPGMFGADTTISSFVTRSIYTTLKASASSTLKWENKYFLLHSIAAQMKEAGYVKGPGWWLAHGHHVQWFS